MLHGVRRGIFISTTCANRSDIDRKMNQLKPPEKLNFEAKNLSTTWKKWRNQFSLYSDLALAEKDESIKKKMLLYVIGERGREVYPTLTITQSEDDRTLINILDAFETFCIPTVNVTVERYRFFSRNQDSSESIDDYNTALRTLSKTCEFVTLEDSLIKDRIVGGITKQETREKLLHTQDLDLQKCLSICRSAEFSEQAIKEISSSNTSNVSMVRKSFKSRNARNPVPRNPATASNDSYHSNERTCKFCNRKHELRAAKCPAWGKSCSTCGERNHFSVQCEFLRNEKKKKPYHGKNRKSVNLMDHEQDDEYDCSDETDSDDYTCVYSVSGKGNIRNKLFAKMMVNNSEVKFQIDCGATCNIVPKGILSDKQLSAINTSRKSVLHMYNNTTESTVGEVMLKMTNPKTSEKFKLLCSVLDDKVISCPPIIGSTAAQSMNLIEVKHENILKLSVQTNPLTKESILKEYNDVFNGQGLLPGECSLRIDESVQPSIQPPRRIPVSLKLPLKAELDRLEQEGIISKENGPTKWVNGLTCVLKPSGKLRICLDPRPLNAALQRNHYPMRTLDDILPDVGNLKVFSVFDAKNGFWHVKLDKKSSKLTCFNTMFGKYIWNRLPFGLNVSSEEYQRRQEEALKGLESVFCIVDDVLVGGKGSTLEEATADHDKNVLAFLERCRETNIVLNKDKMKINHDSVTFMGNKLTNCGIKPDPGKAKAIQEMPPPTDVTGVRRLLGMVNYLSKFVPHLSNLSHPISNLTKNDVEFHWDIEQSTAFAKMKDAISKPPLLSYFDLNQEVTIQCDSSKDGLGCALLQNGKPIAFASRALTDTEKVYAQIEKELLSCVFAVKKFHTYVYGRKFKIENDHKPLETIFKKGIQTAPRRIQAMMIKLHGYDFDYVYKKGTQLFVADTLSRAYLTTEKPSKSETNLYSVNSVTLIPMNDDKLEQLRMFTERDLSVLKTTILNGWPLEREHVPPEIGHYFNFRHELTLHDGIILKGERILIPKDMRKEMMEMIHSSHIGREGCLRRARESIFWPGITTDLKNYMSQCEVCNEINRKQHKEPIIQRELPDRPWQEVGIDLCYIDGLNYLVTVDYYSNYSEIEFLTDMKAETVIAKIKQQFARHGIPNTVYSDNARQFDCDLFRKFSQKWSFKHITSSPTYAASNGKVEEAIQTLKRLILKSKVAKSDPYLAILDFRNTPTQGVGTSPAQRLFGRRTRTLLPTTANLLNPRIHPANERELLIKEKQRIVNNYNKTAKELPELTIGNTVRIQPPPGKVSWKKGIVIDKADHTGRSYTVKTNTGVYRRNRIHLRASTESPDRNVNTQIPVNIDETHNNEALPAVKPHPGIPKAPATDVNLQIPTPQIHSTRTRIIKPPIRYEDYVK